MRRSAGVRLATPPPLASHSLSSAWSPRLTRAAGCFFFLGGYEANVQGLASYGAEAARSNCMCHNTAFDFNDNVLPVAATFWVRPPPHLTAVHSNHLRTFPRTLLPLVPLVPLLPLSPLLLSTSLTLLPTLLAGAPG